MLFNSFGYAVFLPIVFILYWIVPGKYRWIILLMSSYYFYASWGPQYVAVILITTIISYIAALIMDARRKDKIYRKTILALSIIICTGLLFFFKYFNFFTENIALLFDKLSIPMQPFTLKLALPIGISFTFFRLSVILLMFIKVIYVQKRILGFTPSIFLFSRRLCKGLLREGKSCCRNYIHHVLFNLIRPLMV